MTDVQFSNEKIGNLVRKSSSMGKCQHVLYNCIHKMKIMCGRNLGCFMCKRCHVLVPEVYCMFKFRNSVPGRWGQDYGARSGGVGWNVKRIVLYPFPPSNTELCDLQKYPMI